MLKRLGFLLGALLALILFIPVGAANAALPTLPSVATSQQSLNALTVAAEGPMTGYSRSEFPTWITISGACDTRETVLKRDGKNVVTDSACKATSGSWTSAYDGVTITDSSKLDIDHMVPLAEAWRSGAAGWSVDDRKKFANDLTRPQLLAVSASSNRSKGDQDPAQWLPTNTSFRCDYTKAWIAVKAYWKLTIDTAEKAALQKELNAC